MPKIKYFLFILILVAVITLGGCAPQVSFSDNSIVSTQATTVSENWDYITFSNLLGYPDSYTQIIGSAIFQWEQMHPDRKIVSLQIIYRPDSYAYSPKVQGLSIYSQKVP